MIIIVHIIFNIRSRIIIMIFYIILTQRSNDTWTTEQSNKTGVKFCARGSNSATSQNLAESSINKPFIYIFFFFKSLNQMAESIRTPEDFWFQVKTVEWFFSSVFTRDFGFQMRTSVHPLFLYINDLLHLQWFIYLYVRPDTRILNTSVNTNQPHDGFCQINKYKHDFMKHLSQIPNEGDELKKEVECFLENERRWEKILRAPESSCPGSGDDPRRLLSSDVNAGQTEPGGWKISTRGVILKLDVKVEISCVQEE